MQTDLISGSSVQDIAPAGRQPSSNSGEGFAQYFELAGQTVPPDEDRILREPPSDAPAEDEEAGGAADGEIDSGLELDPEVGLPAANAVAKTNGNSDHLAGISVDNPKGIPPTEMLQTIGRTFVEVQSRAATEDARVLAKVQETRQANAAAVAQASNAPQDGIDQTGRALVKSATVSQGNAQPESRAPVPAFRMMSSVTAKGSQAADRIANESTGLMPESASISKPGVSEGPGAGLWRGVGPPRHTAGTIPAQSGIPGPSDGHNPSAAPQPHLRTFAAANLFANQGHSASEYTSAGPVYGPSDQFIAGADQSGRMPNGLAETATLQKAIGQQVSGREVEFTDSFGLAQSKSPAHSVPGQSLEAMPARSETARMVAAQMADAVISAQNNKVGIALNPEELGRVRMVLTTTETGVAISITAERPETLELMRRHIDHLAEEFRSLGYTDIGFEFAEGDARGHFDNESPDDPQEGLMQSASDPNTSEPTPLPTARAMPSRGLDLRL